MHTLEELRAGRLAGVKRLQLRAGLSEFPPEIFSLADSLEILDLSGNALSALPDDLPRLARLRIIFCSDNAFTELPEVLGRCASLTMVGFRACRIDKVSAAALPPALRWLVLTDNRIQSLPDAIGERPLQKLMLSGNRLRALPGSLANCATLELLRIAANQLTALPRWLGEMPRLAWLAFAGNPLAPCARRADCPDVSWSALTVGRQLGEGASGIIFAAELTGQPVAVKLFKGAVTSDGLPDAEMEASIAAGVHPNLIPVLGRITGHPSDAKGLVLALIDPDYRNLAGPPSLDSCTRDIYEDGKRFNLRAALRIAQGVAAAASHLHQQGILHGDLYAHNILHCPQGRPLLGDFGAAAFMPPGDAAWLERIEVRAFGCLLEELADRAAPRPLAPDERSPDGQPMNGLAPNAFLLLRALQADCLAGPVPARPSFAEIEQRLAALDNSI